MDEQMDVPVERMVPEAFTDACKKWDSKANRWRNWEFILGFLSLLLSLLLTTFSDDLSKYLLPLPELRISWLKFVTFLNALAIGLISAFNMSDRAMSVRQAHRQLDAAINMYKHDPTSTIQELTKAYVAALAVMGHARLNLPSKKA